MLHEDHLSITFSHSNNNVCNFDYVQLSDASLNNSTTELRSILDEYVQTNQDDGLLDTSLNLVASTDLLVDILANHIDAQSQNNAIVDQSDVVDENFEFNFNVDLYEETVAQPNESFILESMHYVLNENPFESVADTMVVKVQPKADQRARYASDGPRFLPDARKHPMSIQLPDLSSKFWENNETYGIILTMVTSTQNPKQQTFIHVNGIIYRSNDAIELGNGSIFIPISREEIVRGEKKFPRLSIICKKFDEYTFDLTIFDSSVDEKITNKYSLKNETNLTQAAKGKQFTIDYDLLCYKIIFQLAFKRDDHFFLSHIKCETDLINEQKAHTKCFKRKKDVSKKTGMKKQKCNQSRKSNGRVNRS